MLRGTTHVRWHRGSTPGFKFSMQTLDFFVIPRNIECQWLPCSRRVPIKGKNLPLLDSDLCLFQAVDLLPNHFHLLNLCGH